jgi:hypothetical protein
MKQWICKECETKVISEDMPNFEWMDGHKCKFEEYSMDKEGEQK